MRRFVLTVLFLGIVLTFFLLFRLAFPQRGFALPPNATYHYETPEFTCTAASNSLGFRGDEWRVDSKATTILAIGDSFTFGWGVDRERAWPAIVERRLNAMGHTVRVANAGQCGGHPATYAVIAKRAIPVLKPDIVLIGSLQGDDLAQTIRVATHTRKRVASDNRGALTDVWRSQAQGLLAVYDCCELGRLRAIDATVRSMFIGGGLNPALVNLAITNPRYFVDTLEAERRDVRRAIGQITEYYSTIGQIAEQHNAIAIAVSIPYALFASVHGMEQSRRFGFVVRSEMPTTLVPDKMLGAICDDAGLSCIAVTQDFRERATGTNLFYEYDGHFNEAGHQTFAELLTPLLDTEIRARAL